MKGKTFTCTTPNCGCGKGAKEEDMDPITIAGAVMVANWLFNGRKATPKPKCACGWENDGRGARFCPRCRKGLS